jgi:hypothetical protein
LTRPTPIGLRPSSKSIFAEPALTEYVHFDVWVDGPASPSENHSQRRAELLARIAAHNFVAPAEGEAFVRGARLCLATGLEHEAALRLRDELAPLGLAVVIAPHASPAEMLTLDEVQPLAPDAAVEPEANGDLAMKLVALDDDEAQPIQAAIAPVKAPSAEARFFPPAEASLATELELEAPVASPPVHALALDRVPSRNDEHDAAPESPQSIVSSPSLPGWRGQLRDKPPLRIGIGLALGLGLGFALSEPYAHRAERRVAELRADADRDRYLSSDEAQRRVATVDAAADAAATRGALGAGAIWLVIAGAAFAAWWKVS